MDWNEVGVWTGAAIIVAALLIFPRWFSFRQRAIVGGILFLLGWVGVFVGLALGDQPFMQLEIVAFAWVGICALAILLAITLLVPVLFEWLRKRRKPRRTAERWRAGHWKG
tara:strand:- start:5262 stop:5594 length:333 start_codon:yes stop_codon:yes gene_type:complete